MMRRSLFALPILFLLLFPTPFMPLGLGGVVFLGALRWFALGSPVPRTRINFAILILLASVLWGMLRAPTLTETTLTVARILAGVTTFFIVVDYVERPSRVWNVAGALVGLGLVTVFLAPFVTEAATEKFFNVSFLFNARVPRLWDTSNPNMVAGALAALLPLALALLFSEARALRALGVFALVPLIGMLLLLQSRGAVLAALVGIVVFATLYRRWLLTLVPILFLGLLFLNNAMTEPFQNVPVRAVSTSLISLEGRQEVWWFAARELIQQPLGIGVNAYAQYANHLASDFLSLPQRQHAHNLFLQAGLDTGFIGLGAFCVILGYALYASWHAYRNEVKWEIAMGVFAALFVVLTHGILEPNMWGNKAVVILWGLLGMAVALGRFGARRRGQGERREVKRRSSES